MKPKFVSAIATEVIVASKPASEIRALAAPLQNTCGVRHAYGIRNNPYLPTADENDLMGCLFILTRVLLKIDLKLFGNGLLLDAIVLLALVATLLQTTTWAMSKYKATRLGHTFCPVVGDAAATQVLKTVRQNFDVPAMAVAAVTCDGIKFVGAAGVRKRDTRIPVTLDDLWHLGSDGKAMTSTLIAKLVEHRRLRWDSTLREIFPDLAGGMHHQFQQVTLLQLLSHHRWLCGAVSDQP